ncbi:MAG: methyltransferase domain-containing protein [Firmicutes bacterium]|nr:methyltransferase domain-containing protein [Bacillota bacterium]
MTFQKIYDFSIKKEIYDQYIEIIKPYLDENTRLLDVGCGTGKLLSMLDHNSQYLYGIDHDVQMISYAKTKHPKIHFKIHDMHQPFPYYADIIILSMDVIHFSKDPIIVLSHAVDALDEHGMIVFDYFIKPLSKVREVHEKPVHYTWERNIYQDEIYHRIQFDDTSIELTQYMHLHIDFYQYFKDLDFEVIQISSIDPNKKIIVAKR